MDEEIKKPKEEKQKDTESDSDKGNKYETTPLIERARVEREKLDEANKKKEELLNREEAIMSRKELGGGSEAGQAHVEKKETDEEYVARFQKGEANPLEDDGVK